MLMDGYQQKILAHHGIQFIGLHGDNRIIYLEKDKFIKFEKPDSLSDIYCHSIIATQEYEQLLS